jgi:hypothetical protein
MDKRLKKLSQDKQLKQRLNKLSPDARACVMPLLAANYDIGLDLLTNIELGFMEVTDDGQGGVLLVPTETGWDHFFSSEH